MHVITIYMGAHMIRQILLKYHVSCMDNVWISCMDNVWITEDAIWFYNRYRNKERKYHMKKPFYIII